MCALITTLRVDKKTIFVLPGINFFVTNVHLEQMTSAKS